MNKNEFNKLNKLIVIADAIEYDKEFVIKTGYAIPSAKEDEFLQGILELAKKIGGIPYDELGLEEFDTIHEAAYNEYLDHNSSKAINTASKRMRAFYNVTHLS